jgi:pimeloyl-ACP methyl ester carboxylesterase
MLSLPELKYFSYKNGRLAYREAGVGPTLFLLHGMNGGSQSWAHLFQSLGASFRIVAWDAPGFGASDVFGDSVEDFKGAAIALMDALKLNNAILIGHSMGGVVALKLAIDQEASVSGLILSSTHLGFGCPKGAALMPRYADRIERMISNGVDIAYGRERAKGSTPPETSEDVIEFLAKIAAGSRTEGIRSGGRMSQEANNVEICANVKVPVLILSGEKDAVIPSNMHLDLIAALPEAQQYVFPDAGHASYAEFSDLFNKRVKDFALNVLKLN